MLEITLVDFPYKDLSTVEAQKSLGEQVALRGSRFVKERTGKMAVAAVLEATTIEAPVKFHPYFSVEEFDEVCKTRFCSEAGHALCRSLERNGDGISVLLIIEDTTPRTGK
jgi:hypothetical protein